MKYRLLIILLVIGCVAHAQPLPGHTYVNQRMRYVGVIANDELKIPGYAAFPFTRTGTIPGMNGDLAYDSVLHRFYFRSGNVFRRLVDSSYVAAFINSSAGGGSSYSKPDTVEMFRLNVAATTATNGWTKGTQYNSSSTETIVASGLRIVNTHTGAHTTNYVYNGAWESVANDASPFFEVQVTAIGGTNTKVGAVHEGATDLANIDNFGYVELSDDSVFIQTYTGIHGVGVLSSSIAANDILRIRFRRTYDVFTFTLENITQGLSAESFTYNEAGGTGTSTLTNIYAGLLVQDGTFIVRAFNYYAHNFRPDLMIIGDSRFNGQKLVTPYDSTFAGRFQHFSSWRIELAAKSANKIEDYLQSIKEIRNFESKYYLVDLLYNNLVTGGEDTTDAGPVYLALIDSIKNNGGHVIVTQTAPANNTAPTTIFAYIRDHFQNDPSVHILNLFNTTALYKSDTTNFYDNRYYVDGIHFNEDGQQEIFNYTRTKLESWIRSRPVGAGNEFVYNNGGQFGAASMVQTGGRIWAFPPSTSATPSARFHISSTVFMDSTLHIRNNFSKIHLVTDANGFAYSLRIQNKNNGGAAGDGIRLFSHDSTKGLLLTWNNAATTAFNPSLGTGDFPLWFVSGGSASRFAHSLPGAPFIYGWSGTVAADDREFHYRDSLFLKNLQSATLNSSLYNSIPTYDSATGRFSFVPLATITGGAGTPQGLQEVLDEDPVLTTSETITHAGLQISGTSDLELQSNTLLTFLGAGAEMRLRDSIELDWSGSTSKVLNLGPNLAKNQLANDSMLTYNPTTGRASYRAITSGGVTDHGALTGLSDDDHTQYALLAGRSSGQTLVGGTGTTDDLILQSTSGVGATGALIQFKVGNNGATTAMTVLNNGNVGIGNTNPGNLFHAAGNVGIGTTETTNYLLNLYATTATYFSLHNASSGTTSIDGFQFGLEPTGNYFIGREAIPMYFYTSNAQRMIIEAAGNVGIGDMSPASLLTVGASDAFQVNSAGKLARYAASAWTDGQILIGHTGNGTAEKATITAGTGVTVTNGAGTITIASNDGFTSATTSTSNATPTTIATIATSSNEFGVIEVTMVGHRTTSDGHGITGKKIVRYKNIAGTITVGSITSLLTDELTGLSTATWTITASGSNILIQVTGEAATNIDWSSKYVQTKQVFNP